MNKRRRHPNTVFGSGKTATTKIVFDPDPAAFASRWPSGVNMIELLRSEKYRMQVAISFTDKDKEAMALLSMPERTFYYKKQKYGLKR